MKEKRGPRKSRCYCIHLRRAANAVTKFYDKELEETGITLNQYSLLSNLFQMESASVTELADAVKLERTTVTRTIRPLFDQGLIEDISPRGARVREVRLTEEGERKLRQCESDWNRAQKEMEEILDKPELLELISKLDFLEESLATRKGRK